MFKDIFSLLIDNFANTKEDGYVSFVTDAISVIYHVSIRMMNDNVNFVGKHY